MTLTVRLTPHLEAQLDKYCQSRRVTKTRVVTELLSEHLMNSGKAGKTPYELAREVELVGSFASTGPGDLAQNRKRYLTEILRAKRAR
jgi:hypothetical protein